MQKYLKTLVLCGLLVSTAATGRSQETKGFRGDLIGQIEYVQKQILDLENSIPDAKMSWRPNDEVRSVSEVYAHIAYDNYAISKFAGLIPPEGIAMGSPDDAQKWEKATTDKKVVHDELAKSFEFVKNGIKSMPDANLEKTVEFFGNKMSARSVLLVLLSHVHEHLGQSIAYARMVGVVPPWTAARMAAEKAKK